MSILNKQVLEYVSQDHLSCTFMDDGITRERDYVIELWGITNTPTNDHIASIAHSKLTKYLKDNPLIVHIVEPTPSLKRERPTGDDTECYKCKKSTNATNSYQCVQFPDCPGSYCESCFDGIIGACENCDQQICFSHLNGDNMCEACLKFLAEKKETKRVKLNKK